MLTKDLLWFYMSVIKATIIIQAHAQTYNSQFACESSQHNSQGELSEYIGNSQFTSESSEHITANSQVNRVNI